MNIVLGSGSDSFTIEDTHAAPTYLNTAQGNDLVNVQKVSGETEIETDAGDDELRIGSKADTTYSTWLSESTLDGVFNARLVVDGQTGAGPFAVSADSVPSGGTVTPSQLSTSVWNVTLTGTATPLDLWSLNVDGIDFDYRVDDGDSMNDVAAELSALIGEDSLFNTSVSGTTITVTKVGDRDKIVLSDRGDSSSNVNSLAGELTASQVSGLGIDSFFQYLDFETLQLYLSGSSDELFVSSTHAGNSEIFGGSGSDVVGIRSTTGPTSVFLGGGDDLVQVNFNADGSQTNLDGIGDRLTLDGEDDTDVFDIALSGTGSSLIDVFDTAGVTDSGVDALNIYGTPENDFFLMRANNLRDALPDDQIGIISAVEVDADRQPVPGGVVERVNYRSGIEGGIRVFGRDGDDTFVLDDTKAPLILFGDAGADTFQIGQIFKSPRDGSNPDHGLEPDEYFETTLITRGYLSNGISHTTTIFGGIGNDNFTVYRNRAELFLFGEEDDDTFLIRAFVKVDPDDPKAPFTNINGGQGADFVSFTVNAPVRIEGGDGFDTLTVVGTEFGDDFVVTEDGVFGGGLFITYNGVEKVDVDALEGNDRFFIESTSEKVVVEIIGGVGSDTFNVSGGTGDEPITVVSNGLEGHSGLVKHALSSTDGQYHDIYVKDLAVKVADNDEAGIVINRSEGPMQVFEEDLSLLNLVQGAVLDKMVNALVHTYTVVLTRSPQETVRVTAAPVPLAETAQDAGAKNITLNGSELGTTLFFDRSNWFIPQTVVVAAQDDTLALGRRPAVIQHTVVEGVSADDRGEYDNLAVLSVVAEVIDNDASDVVIVQSKDDSIVAEVADTNDVGDLPVEDTYFVSLSRRPAANVTIQLGHDSQLVAGTTNTDPQTLTFTPDKWYDPKEVTVSAGIDSLKEGVHYSRITHDFEDLTCARQLPQPEPARRSAEPVVGDQR